MAKLSPGQAASQDLGTPPRHMPALDGLRGLAISLVLCCHANLAIGGNDQRHSSFGWIRSLVLGSGWVGVDLFFVLSGFLITGILLSTKGATHYFRSFFARRFLRIFPLYYIFVAVTLIAERSAFHAQDVASLLLYYYNFHAVHLLHPLPTIGILWSLAVEEQFYLLWPFVVFWLDTRRLVQLCLVGTFLAFSLRLWFLARPYGIEAAYYLTPCRMDDLLVGALLAAWHTNQAAWHRVRRSAGVALSLSFLGLAIIAFRTGHFFTLVTDGDHQTLHHSSALILGPGLTLLAIFFGACVVLCTGQNAVSQFLLRRPFRVLGKYSYGIYVLHSPLLALLHDAFWRHHRFRGFTLSPLLLLPATFLCSVGLAMISFHVLEKPFLRLKRYFPATERAATPHHHPSPA